MKRMKKVLALALLLCMLLPGVSVAGAVEAASVDAEDSGEYLLFSATINMYASAEKNAARIGRVKSGHFVEVLKWLTKTQALVRNGDITGVVGASTARSYHAYAGQTTRMLLGSDTNVYYGVAKDALKLGTLKKNDEVQKVGVYGTKTVIQYGGMVGCVETRKLVYPPLPPVLDELGQEVTGRVEYVKATEKIKVYKDASDKSTVVGYFYPDTVAKFEGYKERNEWVCILFNGQKRYVRTQYVVKATYSEDPVLNAASGYAQAMELIDIINTYRIAEGLESLTIEANLMEAARERAYELPRKYSATRPLGGKMSDFWSVKSENRARGSFSLGDPRAAVDNMMAVPGFRANAMDKRITKTGAAYIEVKDKVYWIQLFGE